MMARPLRFWESSLFAAFLFRQTGGRAAKSTCYTIRRLSTQPARLPRMDYQDAICTLNTLQTNASFLEQVKRERGQPQMQLEAMRLFLQRVGLKVEDLDQLNIIHVTGTKGKGSTCAFAEKILRNYGLRTGFYSSPHLVQVRERIRINGQPISKELFTKYFWQVYNRLEKTKDAHYGTMPAYFRFLTLMAFHVFLQEKVDLAIIEVGIGGAYDCTNIIKTPWVCGVSSLGIDHTSILGDTIEKIAWQKGGIFKLGVPAFTVKQPEGPMRVLAERAQEIGCPLHVCPDLTQYECEGHRLPLGLAGAHQRSNASLALQICRSWLQHRGFYADFPSIEKMEQPTQALLNSRPAMATAFLPSSAMATGLRETEWPGRTQTLKHGPITYYLDGAHTTRSIQACVDWFRETAMLEEKTTVGSVVRVLLFNATGERDSPALLKLLVPCQFDCAVFCPNITEAVSSASADQHNYNVTVENMLTRCLDNQKSWRWLSEKEVVPRAELLLPGGLPLMTGTVHRGVESLVFPCIHSALRWITQGRDPVIGYSGKPSTLATMQPGAIAGARTLQEAANIQVLVTGSLHLVGGVLKLLDPVLSQ
ncbi:folylpolyglutamate synthase, mitochondrial isoform X1 [Erpetoichthys calabaricus]|uniref:Folylpolyglutamate synthase n=1 Tax=Erpetoichthys calabaricus TaxID=27687 RepID=A0A8C4T2P9_ERPCA|nr:folylpolyglutamate synthase, mitochondrial isoform X1 [Erpetoichthys calabaricus]